MSLEWDDFFEEEVRQASGPDPDEIEDAERCRTHSSLESEDTPDILSRWWSHVLKKAAIDAGYT